jgi:RNA recognition motif-containing protein
MPSDYTPSSSRRRSPRRRQGSGDSGPRNQPARKPKTLWQKIASFFSDKPSGAPAPERRSSSAGRTSGQREPRNEREPRGERRSQRPPEAVEVTSPRLYVGNLSFDAVESDLHELFSGVGTVAEVEIVSNRHTQRSKGFAFVQMQTIEEAKRAVDELHDKEYMGRKLLVSGAKAPEERRTDRSAQPEQ